MKKVTLLLILFYVNLSFSQQKDYEVFNTAINSKFAELGTTFLKNNTLIFASSKKIDDDKNFLKDRRKNNGQSFLEFYTGIVNDKGDIIETGKFTNEIKNKFFEADITFSPDLKTVYFAWNNFYSIESKEDIEKWKTLRIVKATLNENFETSDITFLPFNSETYSVRSPIVSNNGKKLFFVSDMPGGYGESDIYFVDIHTDGTYGKPVNLGPNINSAYDEQYPTLDANETLYFSTIGRSGKGGLDIFKSEFKNGEYQKAENLPEPINSKFDEFGFVYNNATDSGFFTSNRKDGIGNVDIYAFVPKELLCKQDFEFNFVDEKTKKEIDNLNITLTNSDNQIVEVLSDKNNLAYKTQLKCNLTYKLIVEKEQYVPFETFITTNNTLNNKISETYNLTPLDCNQAVEITILFEDNNKTVENCTVLIVDNKGSVLTQTVDNTHKISFKADCNTSYNVIANATNYLQSEIAFSTDSAYDTQFKKEITLTKKSCNQTITGVITNSNKLPLTANISLFIDGKLIEKQVTNNFNFKVNCNATYVILAEADNYQQSEILIKTGANANIVNNASLELQPKICNQVVEVNVNTNTTDFELNNATVALYSNNVLMEQKNINNSNTVSFNLNCNTSYKIIATATNFENNEISFKTDTENNFKINKSITLTAKKCQQKIELLVFNKLTNQQIKNTKVSIYSNNMLLEEKYIVNNNALIFDVACNTSYKIIGEAENFESEQLEFNTDLTFDSSTTKQLYLNPKPCIQTLTLSIFNKETKEALQEAKVTIFKNNEILNTHILANETTSNLKLNCDTNYNIKVELEKFDTQFFEFQTTNIYNSELNKIIYLTPSVEYVTLGGQKLINTNNIYFDLDKADIRNDAAIELNKVVSYLINHPTIKIEVKSHTDSRAPDNYNLKLSDRRAKSVINYIISKGIDALRVTGKGYGETQLLNECSNGVKCTEAQHQLNRRTEFVIIE